MTRDSLQHLHHEFRGFIERQPYSVTLDGLRLTIDKDVFPPDMGLCARNLAGISRRYEAEHALDMGCGTAYLALMLKKSGVADVWASDVHAPAVACAQRNAAYNSRVGPINVVQSDLFEEMPSSVRFDLIVFNQPFGPGNGQRICGCGPDGGYDICRRFLIESPGHLSENGVVLMPFSDREASQHSPRNVARELGYTVDTVLDEYYSESNNYIFEIRPR
jgi:release factor glutamine methyltransferase